MPQYEFKIGDIVRIKFIHEDFLNGDPNSLALLKKAIAHQHRVAQAGESGTDAWVEIYVNDDGTPGDASADSFYLKPEELALVQSQT